MTSSSGHSDIDHVRDATDLVRLIGEHVALKPSGREHVGICPFHEDHRPSMHVVTHKGHAFYKCFACGASGDCFRFVIDYHKMEFIEALRYLADRAGITLTPRTEHSESNAGPRRAELQRAAEFACDFFRRNLRESSKGEAARAVIENRGISTEMTESFALGAAPEGYDSFLSTLGGKASAIQTALAAGLLKEKPESGHRYDAFRNRLIFPICDDVGRPIAFGGRIIDPEDIPKYLNSSESPLFNKSRTLYGLHLAKRSIIESKEAIVTEGYTDVIACHQAGITNAVGTLGTSLTSEHARILSRICDTVYLVFDGDEAGQKAADRSIEIFSEGKVDIRICVLSDGLDPDELLKQADGTERFREAIKGGTEFLEFMIRAFRKDLGPATALSARQKQLEAFLTRLADLGFGSMQGVRKRMVLTQLSDLLRIPVADIEAALPRRRSRPAPAQPRPEVMESTATTDEASPPPHTLLPEESEAIEVSRARRIAERELLSILLFEPAAGQGDEETPPVTSFLSTGDFTDGASRRIADVIFPRLEERSPFTMQEVLMRLDDREAHALASQLFFDGQRRCSDQEGVAKEEIQAAAEVLQSCIRRERHQEQLAAFRAQGGGMEDAAEIGTVIERIREQHRRGTMPSAMPQGVRS